MSDKLYLVDGSGYIFRAFFATPPLTNDEGMPTNALYAFTRMMVRLLSDYHPHKIAVVFDTSSKNFRHELYPEYKANRTECPEDLVPQMPYFRDIVKALGIVCLEKEGYEADDIIATLAAHAVEEGSEVEIFSGDKDLLQLVDGVVEVRDVMKDKVYDRKGVEDKFGVPPERMTDYLALVGDSSDNVPGIQGVGPKSAVKLITELGGVEDIIAGADRIAEIKGLRGAKSIAEKVKNGVEQLRLSYKLVQLDSDVYEPRPLEEFKRGHISLAEVDELFGKLGFSDTKKMLGSLEISDSAPEDVPEHDKDYQLVTSENSAAVIKRLRKSTKIGFDTETDSLDVSVANMLGISLAPEPYVAFYFAGEELEKHRKELEELFCDKSKTYFGFNLKYDLRILSNAGIKFEAPISDAMIGAYLLHPDRKRGGLKKMTESVFGEKMLTYEELVGEAKDLTELSPGEVAPYACHDADASLRLALKFEQQLGAVSGELLGLYQEIEMPLLPILTKMEETGIMVDTAGLEELKEEFEAELEKLEATIFSLADTEFNINSPKQVSEVLFDRLGLPTTGIKKTSHGYSTDVNALNRLSGKHEVANKLLEYREISKLLGTYVKGLQKLVRKDTSRVHTTYNQAVAATGRLSSSDPNLQNLPIRGERGRKVRQVFIARPDYTLLSLDYSQVELRILAHLSEDEGLIEAFRNGLDIHEQTARQVFADRYEEGLSDTEAKELRRIAKTINFGVIYGVSAFRLARDLEIPQKTAKAFIDGYFERYSAVKEYFEEASQLVEEQGYADTLFGRRRFLAEIDSSGRDSGYGRRSLMNFPIQGSAADIIKIAMIEVTERLKNHFDSGDLYLLMQVHDELVFEVKRPMLEQISLEIKGVMEDCVELLVPLEVDYEDGPRWQ